MLTVSYKIKGILFDEFWFSSDISQKSKTFFGLYCYRDSLIDIEKNGLKKEEKYTLINDLTLEKDKLFSQFKSNVRNEIRKCEKIENFKYNFDKTSKEEFLSFYTKFANAKSLALIKKKSIDKYGDNILYISAYIEGKLTNMQVYLVDEEAGIARLLHSISTLHETNDPTVRAKIGWVNRYLHWIMMLHFKSLSFKIFDWGGYNNGEDPGLAGIDKFKTSFGGEKIKRFDYYSYSYYIMKIIQEKL